MKLLYEIGYWRGGFKEKKRFSHTFIRYGYNLFACPRFVHSLCLHLSLFPLHFSFSFCHCFLFTYTYIFKVTSFPCVKSSYQKKQCRFQMISWNILEITFVLNHLDIESVSKSYEHYFFLQRLVGFLDVIYILNTRMYIPCSGWYFLWTFFFVEQYMHLEYFIRKSRQIWEKMAASFIHEILLIASDRWWSVVT